MFVHRVISPVLISKMNDPFIYFFYFLFLKNDIYLFLSYKKICDFISNAIFINIALLIFFFLLNNHFFFIEIKLFLNNFNPSLTYLWYFFNRRCFFVSNGWGWDPESEQSPTYFSYFLIRSYRLNCFSLVKKKKLFFFFNFTTKIYKNFSFLLTFFLTKLRKVNSYQLVKKHFMKKKKATNFLSFLYFSLKWY